MKDGQNFKEEFAVTFEMENQNYIGLSVIKSTSCTGKMFHIIPVPVGTLLEHHCFTERNHRGLKVSGLLSGSEVILRQKKMSSSTHYSDIIATVAHGSSTPIINI